MLNQSVLYQHQILSKNCARFSSINTHYIEYKYDYNRLLGIFLPDLPSGDPNPSKVQYQYGLSTAGNNAGKIIAKTDGSGDTVYKYGRMGEVISELRIVRGANIPEMYFKTYFNYDSWNRLTKIKYPDEELVSYHYDRGGNLKSVNNNYGETLITNSNYDNFEQRLKITYGNGTSQHYAYNAQNRRLDRYYLMTNTSQMMLHNTYKYDQFSNISMIQNQADPLANGMGGAFQFNLNYDTLNRLIGTETGEVIIREKEGQIPITSFTPSTYNLVMEYNNVGGITRKHQHHERDQNVVHENTYENKYEYVQNTHKLEKVGDISTGNAEYFEYDFNGNAVNHNDSNGVKRMFWDEQDRLRAFYNDNTGTYQYYTYDDQGERVIKYGLEIPTQLYHNWVPIKIHELKLFEYKLYPNPYITVSSTGQYTKHYFEGSKRFASRLIDGAVRFEDPAVLYTNRSEEDKPAAKPADVKSDFEKYLEKSGLDNGVSVELRERNWSPDLYYLHGDHLGTATFVTNSQSQATQFFLNLPFGETMIEQMDGSYDNPFKFNAKELDEDTGLYYYGARYYNPRLSIWYGVDPLANKFPNWSPFTYTFDNPVRYTDPDGMAPKDIIIWYKNDKGIETKYVYGSKDPVPQNQFVQNTIKTIDHLVNKKAFDNFIAYGKIKIDGNFLSKVINDKNRSLHVVAPDIDKSVRSSRYKRQGYDSGKFKNDGSYGTILFNDEYGFEFEKDGKKYTNSPASGFGHEFTHTLHANYNVETNSIYNSGRGNGENKLEEQNTVNDANQINSILGEEIRIDHSATQLIKMDDPVKNKQSK